MGKKRKKKKKRQRKSSFISTDLIIAVDRSKGRKTTYSFVSILEPNLKKLPQTAPWLSHIARKTKQEKRSYLKRFPERFQKVKPLLEDWKIDPELKEIETRMRRKPYKLAVIDDDLYERKKLPTNKAIKESVGKQQSNLRPLINLADNLAYIGREEYEKSKDIREFKRKLRKLGL